MKLLSKEVSIFYCNPSLEVHSVLTLTTRSKNIHHIWVVSVARPWIEVCHDSDSPIAQWLLQFFGGIHAELLT